MKIRLFNYEIITKKLSKRKEFKPMRSSANDKIELDMNKVYLMKSNGTSNRNIAKLLGVSEATIRNRLKDESMR